MAKAEGESTKARGYDDPAKVDLLGRRPLARIIAEVIRNTPPELGVRIGVFGEWGSGKSSVLNFIEEILDAPEHVVVRFSPWGIGDRTELWRRLGVALAERLQGTGDGPRGPLLTRLKFKYDKQALKLLGVGQRLTRFVPHAGPYLEALSGPMLDAVQHVLSATENQLTSFAKPGERIVVVIDDLDRADPSLVPPILFALRELFDVRRFSWILAMDPVVVRAALEKYHPGFARGRDFLEKIVDFPFHLHAPDRAHRVALLRRDLAESEIKLDDVNLAELRGLLPENPRELRAVVRHLRTIAGTLARLRPDEIDRRLLLIMVVIHAAAPNLLEHLLSSRKILRRITGLKFFEKDDRAKEVLEEARGKIRRLLEESNIREQERPRLMQLLLRLGNGGYWAPETIIAVGRLLHAAPVVTGREADEAIEAAQDASGLLRWLGAFASRRDCSDVEVRGSLFNHLLATHDRAMNNAIGAFAHEDMERAVAAVIRAVKVLEMLLFDLGEVSKLKAARLEKMRQAFSQWAHFVHPQEYGPARQAERDLLLRFAKSSELDPLTALDRVKPVRDRDLIRDEGDEARRSLNLDLLSALEERAVGKFIDMLDRENLVLVFGHWRRAGMYLLRGDGLIWTARFRDQLRGALDGERSVARAENARELLRSAIKLLPDARSAIFADADLVGLLWRATTAVAPNMRMFESVERLRREVEEATSQSLPDPPWWGPKREQYLLATRRRDATEHPTRKEEAAGG